MIIITKTKFVVVIETVGNIIFFLNGESTEYLTEIASEVFGVFDLGDSRPALMCIVIVVARVMPLVADNMEQTTPDSKISNAFSKDIERRKII